MMAFMMPMIGMMGGMWSDGATMMSPLWNIAMMLLFLVVLTGIGYLIYRAITRGLVSNVNPALEELRLSYARGELSQEEFEQRKEDLQRTK